MESGGKFSGHRRTSGEGPVERDYSMVLLRNDSGAKTVVPVSRRTYVFDIGQILSVDKRDVPFLLSLHRGASCAGCGGSGSTPLFSIVEA